ncbi:MAG: four helix bundle protein [Thermoanaerobaculia bacterium]|nr:four helix bundle protein [Thermoanaerobaculia bacterium]
MNKSEKTKFDLEQRLVEFAVRVIDLAEALPKTFVGKHIGGQIIRSGTSPALNYAEAQAAESMADFVHKMKICLKELRETLVSLKIILQKGYFKTERLDPLLKENDELIAIFVKSVNTAKVNSAKGKE